MQLQKFDECIKWENKGKLCTNITIKKKILPNFYFLFY